MSRNASTGQALSPLLRDGNSLTAGATGHIVSMVPLPDGSGMYYLALGLQEGKADNNVFYVYKVGGSSPPTRAQPLCFHRRLAVRCGS